MATFTSPVANLATFRYTESSTPQQKALYKYMRPLDLSVNVYILSDLTVVTDFPCPIANGQTSSSAVPWHLWRADMPQVGANEGASGGPFAQPPPYSTVFTAFANPPVQSFNDSPWIKYWFQAAGVYPGISANLVSILNGAGYGAYIS